MQSFWLNPWVVGFGVALVLGFVGWIVRHFRRRRIPYVRADNHGVAVGPITQSGHTNVTNIASPIAPSPEEMARAAYRAAGEHARMECARMLFRAARDIHNALAGSETFYGNLVPALGAQVLRDPSARLGELLDAARPIDPTHLRDVKLEDEVKATLAQVGYFHERQIAIASRPHPDAPQNYEPIPTAPIERSMMIESAKSARSRLAALMERLRPITGEAGPPP